MPDITMCKDHDCPKREDCYRYKAAPSMFQSYFKGTPRRGDWCSYFMRREPKEGKG